MNLEQLKKKRDSCVEIINKATAEKEEIDEQIDRIVIVHTKKALSKCKLSVTELMKLGEITPEIIMKQLNKKMDKKPLNKKMDKKLLNKKITLKLINQKITMKLINPKITMKLLNKKITLKAEFKTEFLNKTKNILI